MIRLNIAQMHVFVHVIWLNYVQKLQPAEWLKLQSHETKLMYTVSAKNTEKIERNRQNEQNHAKHGKPNESLDFH